MNRILFKYSLILLLTVFGLSASAQLVSFENLTMADGLSSPHVYSIGQDQYGLIWVGTGNGLNIYDGIRFRHYFSEEGDETSLPGNYVSDLVFTGDSAWIGTQNGLCVMDVKNRKCVRIDLGAIKNVRTLFLAKKSQTLWIGTQSGLVEYSISTGRFKEYNTTNSNISNNIIRSIYEDSDGTLWVGTFNKLNKLQANSTVFETIELDEDSDQELKNHLILSINPMNRKVDSLLWIGMQTGLVQYNRHTSERIVYDDAMSELTNNVIKVIHTSSEGKLWMGTDFGLVEMSTDNNQEVYLHDPLNTSSITNSVVWDIFEDNAGTIWFGTNNGISILSNKTGRFGFFPATLLSNGQTAGYEVRGIIEDSNEDVWLATQRGMIPYGHGNQVLEDFNARRGLINDIKSVFEDSKGRIWLATNLGVAIYTPGEETLETYSADFNSGKGLRTNYISGFKELASGDMLINSYQSLHIGKENADGLTFEFIGNLRIDGVGEDYLWSFNDLGLIRVDPETFEQKPELTLSALDGPSSISSVLIENNRDIWLGLENGLIRYNLQSKEHEVFEIRSNRPYPLINLLSDREGNIWASSYSAILKFSIESKEFEIYPSGDEIPINRFIEKCALKTRSGELIFGGEDGFIKFSPGEITKSDFIAPLRFTNLIVANNEVPWSSEVEGKSIIDQDIPFAKEMILDYENASFTIEFSSLHYGNRDGIRYAYLLEGKDNEWNYINDEYGHAIFSRLSADDYLLRVKGTNNDGVWNPDETTLHIKVKPPYWASPVFIVIYLVLIFLIFAGFLSYYFRQTKWKNQMKIIRLEKEHAGIVARDRQQFFTNIAHEFRTPLSLIIGPAEKLASNPALDEAGYNYVKLIDNNARRLLWLNNQLLDFRKVENKSMKLRVSEFDIVDFTRSVFLIFADKAERKKISYSFETEIEHLDVKMDLRKVETIFFNLLSNAFKFTPEMGSISVKIQVVDNESKGDLSISVKDSGMGIPVEYQEQIFKRFFQTKESISLERGTGIGLTLVDEYVRMHNGRIMLESQPGEGSDFRLLFPLNYDYPSEITVVTGKDSIEPIIKSGTTNEVTNTTDAASVGSSYILLIEDDKEIADFIVMSLKEKYRIKLATNGKIAFQSISKQLPILVISDIIMPEMDGIKFTRKFKSNPKTSHIPLILLSGQSQMEDQLEGLKSGADAYIVKPFTIDLLEVRIDNFLKRREQLAEFLIHDNIAKPSEVQITSQDEKMLEKVVACIEKYMSDPELRISKVSRHTGFSHPYLYRKIKSLTGQTVNEFIRTVRVKRAEQLLRTKRFTVAEVMNETGFTNHSYFSKCFRKLYHISPKEYIITA